MGQQQSLPGFEQDTPVETYLPGVPSREKTSANLGYNHSPILNSMGEEIEFFEDLGGFCERFGEVTGREEYNNGIIQVCGMPQETNITKRSGEKEKLVNISYSIGFNIPEEYVELFRLKRSYERDHDDPVEEVVEDGLSELKEMVNSYDFNSEIHKSVNSRFPILYFRHNSFSDDNTSE